VDGLTIEIGLGRDLVPLRRRVKLFLTSRGVIRPGRHPWLAVSSSGGRRWPLWETANWDEAREKRERLLHELSTLGSAAWCRRYNVPADFTSRDRTVA